MRIKKLTNSSVLKPGKLLVVLNCFKQWGHDAPVDLQKIIGTGIVQFYRHRHDPVPSIGRVKHHRLFRHPRTTSERRAHFSNEAAEEVLEFYGVALKLRQKRSSHWLPNSWDDISRPRHRSWKEHRRTQRKNAGGIDRRVHSPPFWAW